MATDRRTDEPARPDPEALLAATKREGRGHLKIFLGAAPGVGKTFAMLEAARRRRAEGDDVVVGLVETHGRADTMALVEGLELLPRRRVEYRGQTLEEFDLDAALRRRPQLILVDELAHTNAPGGRHEKRWQDVEELLDAGIDVDTTLNIQHLESLNDVVARITRIRVRETLPDVVLERADSIELVDLEPDELLARLAEGKVYVPEQAKRAAKHYFKPGNLTALRELALRRTAERVDAQMVDYMRRHAIEGPWPAGERIMVCVSPSPDPLRLVRAGRRLADQTRGRFTAVYVETPSHARLPEAARDRIAAALRLAEKLGGDARTLPGGDIVAEILRFARSHNVTQLVIGKVRRGRLAEFLRPSLVHTLLREGSGPAIHVLPAEVAEGVPLLARLQLRPDERHPVPYAVSALAVAACGLAAQALDYWLDLSTLSLVFLVGVLFSAATFGLVPAIFAAVLSMLVYNFFFLPPLYTLTIQDPENAITLATFLVVAVLTSNLAGRARGQARAARRRYKTAAALHDFSRKVAGARDLDDVLWIVCHQIAAMLDARIVALLPAEGRLAIQAGYPPEDSLPDADWAAAHWAWEKAEPAGLMTDTLPNAERHYRPASTAGGVVAVIGIQPARASTLHEPEPRRLIDALVDQAAVAIERARLERERAETRVAQESEKLRTAMLSSISHDLRTPLASIIGAVTALERDAEGEGAARRRELAATAHEEAARLDRFVANLLDMTRLEAGGLAPRRDWVSAAEIVGGAVRRARPLLKDRPVEIDVPASLPLLRVDAVLLEQVLFNLLDNAAKWGPPGRPVRVRGTASADAVTLAVADEGPGVPHEDLERIFDRFHRVRSGDRTVAGTGLGLSICRGIVEAHGGTIAASPAGPEGGLEVALRLPVERQPAPAPADAAAGPAGA